MKDEWLTVAEVATTLRLHPDTIRRLLRRGDLKGSFIGGRGGYRIAAADVETFMATAKPRRRGGNRAEHADRERAL
jgi:excisionase family DNA binding protein